MEVCCIKKKKRDSGTNIRKKKGLPPDIVIYKTGVPRTLPGPPHLGLQPGITCQKTRAFILRAYTEDERKNGSSPAKSKGRKKRDVDGGTRNMQPRWNRQQAVGLMVNNCSQGKKKMHETRPNQTAGKRPTQSTQLWYQ